MNFANTLISAVLSSYIVLLAHKAEFGISGFGVSITTMEEVFIKVGEGANTMEKRYLKCILVLLHS